MRKPKNTIYDTYLKLNDKYPENKIPSSLKRRTRSFTTDQFVKSKNRINIFNVTNEISSINNNLKNIGL